MALPIEVTATNFFWTSLTGLAILYSLVMAGIIDQWQITAGEGNHPEVAKLVRLHTKWQRRLSALANDPQGRESQTSRIVRQADSGLLVDYIAIIQAMEAATEDVSGSSPHDYLNWYFHFARFLRSYMSQAPSSTIHQGRTGGSSRRV